MTDPTPKPKAKTNSPAHDEDAGLFEKPPAEDEGHDQDKGLTLNDDEWEAYVDGFDDYVKEEAERKKAGP